MDIKEIKQIVEMMKRSDLTEFEIEEKDLKLRICRHSGQAEVAAMAQGGSNAPFPVVAQGTVPVPPVQVPPPGNPV